MEIIGKLLKSMMKKKVVEAAPLAEKATQSFATNPKVPSGLSRLDSAKFVNSYDRDVEMKELFQKLSKKKGV